MKSILLTALSCFFCLGICSQQYYNDTIFTTDKKIPAYIDVSKGNHLRGVYSNHVERQSIFVNTIGWKRGLYAIKAVVNGEETSCKVIL